MPPGHEARPIQTLIPEWPSYTGRLLTAPQCAPVLHQTITFETVSLPQPAGHVRESPYVKLPPRHNCIIQPYYVHALQLAPPWRLARCTSADACLFIQRMITRNMHCHQLYSSAVQSTLTRRVYILPRSVHAAHEAPLQHSNPLDHCTYARPD